MEIRKNLTYFTITPDPDWAKLVIEISGLVIEFEFNRIETGRRVLRYLCNCGYIDNGKVVSYSQFLNIRYWKPSVGTPPKLKIYITYPHK